MNRMEMETFFRLKVDSLLMTASWVERVRTELGLVGVSQVWTEGPAWYLWLEGSPGAYGLELVDASSVDQSGPEVVQGLFTVRYYPSPDEPVFSGFSAQEQALVQGAGFDQSGTPRFEALSGIPPQCFVVGTLQLALQPDAEWALFELSALETCRYVITPGPGQPSELARQVPGRSLCYRLFRPLLGLYAFTSRHTPIRARLCQFLGMEQVEADGEISWRNADGVSLQSLEVLFGSMPGEQPRAARDLLDQSKPSDPARVLLDEVFDCAHYHGPEESFISEPILSPSWWRLAAADYKSELASSCGCEH